MQAITTRFIPCTNTKGSRIKAYTESGVSITLSYSHEINAYENHIEVMKALCRKLKWTGKLWTGGLKDGGYVHVFETLDGPTVIS